MSRLNFVTAPQHSRRFISTLALAGAIALSSSTMLWQTSTSAYPVLPQVEHSGRDSATSSQLPRRVRNRVLRHLARQTDIPRDALSIAGYRSATWSNGCLGLPAPNQFCTMALVDGWQVEVTDGASTWLYRTDETGRSIRLETQLSDSGELPSSELPSAVGDRILQRAAQTANVPVSQLSIVDAEPRVWDGCLGIAPPSGGGCTKIALQGWQVVVAGNGQSWIYHADQTASDVRLNAAASSGSGEILPGFLSDAEQPDALEAGVVFRAIASGGFAGQTIETTLLEDGRLMQRSRLSVDTSPVQIKQLTPQQVEQFQQLLEDHQFANFDGIHYPAPAGAADYITMTLTTQSNVTTQYVDFLQDQLPTTLQPVISAWNQVLTSPQEVTFSPASNFTR